MMLRRASKRPLCGTCSRQLLDLFVGGFAAPASRALPASYGERRLPSQRRLFHRNPRTRQEIRPSPPIPKKDAAEETGSSSPKISEAVELEDLTTTETTVDFRVSQARQLFGDTLPEGYLTPEEYKVYERLYGAPIATTNPEDEALLEPLEEESEDAIPGEQLEQHALFKETEEGDLEEVEYGGEERPDKAGLDLDSLMTQQRGESAEQFQQRKELYEAVANAQGGMGSLDEQTAMLQDLQHSETLVRAEIEAREMEHGATTQETHFEEAPPAGYEWSTEDFEANEEADEDFLTSRVHPLTEAGRFKSSPKTIRVPAVELTEPVQRYLATTARYEHLIQSANTIFGGPRLPNSNATPRKLTGPVQQKPPALLASQHNMTQIQANLFMAAIMPGAYASSKSVLIEIRRRLGGDWLEDLLSRPGGPRILDAGAGGAGVIAWRELLHAQWDIMHEGKLSQGPVPYGSSTVVAGSRMLQDAASKLLQETSFIPRLPDFNRIRDLPAERDGEDKPRKQYDLIIAPYTLYGIEEDYMKKAQVQNLWSLLDPNGGVLIILEKGVPKGFENVAGARKVLLEHHIRNPTPGQQEQVPPLIGNYHTNLEDGMIIAPCTNHNQCPMYTFSGESVGRKDICVFKQRYERPPFLQRIHGAKFHNHEDINFSYIAVRRGRDQRKEHSFVQNEEATKRAFEGYEEKDIGEVALQTLPRVLKQPLKRTGHITFDLCTPSGTLERWTTPKSFSHQAYRDARKAQWGDLWALGAKTRVQVSARVGRPKDEKKSNKINFETGEKYDDETDQAEHQNRQAEMAKRRTARMRKAKATRQPKHANDTRKNVVEGNDDLA